MAVAVKFEALSEHLAKKGHDLNADTIKIMLSNDVPSASLDALKTDLTSELGAGNGYTAGGMDIQNTTSRAAGVTTVTATDCVWTASGAVGPFRYVVAYNDTASTPFAKPLIAYWDYGSPISLASGETFTADFTTGLLTIT